MPTAIVSTKLVFQLVHVVVMVKLLSVQIKETQRLHSIKSDFYW